MAVFTVSSTLYNPGSRDISIPVGVLDSDTTVKASFSRENWPICEGTPGNPCSVIEVAVYASVNGGPLQNLCGFRTEGGDILNRSGNLITESSIECSLPPGTLRTVIIAMTNSVPLQTAMTITTS